MTHSSRSEGLRRGKVTSGGRSGVGSQSRGSSRATKSLSWVEQPIHGKSIVARPIVARPILGGPMLGGPTSAAKIEGSHAGVRANKKGSAHAKQKQSVRAHQTSRVHGESKGENAPKLLFQKAFKSLGQRQYEAVLKELESGNHLLTLSESRRDPTTGEAHKTKISIFGEDLTPFFRLLHDTATFIRANPLPDEVRQRREKFWARKGRQNGSGG